VGHYSGVAARDVAAGPRGVVAGVGGPVSVAVQAVVEVVFVQGMLVKAEVVLVLVPGGHGRSFGTG
jgi:hypothetical protein